MKGRCIWCGEKDENLQKVTVMARNRFGFRPREKAFLVHAEHERVFMEFNAYAQRFGRLFLGLVAVAIGMLLVTAWNPLVTGATVALIGIVFWVLPFATPETVRGAGLKAARQTLRGLAVLVMGLGVLIALGNVK